MIVLYSRNQLHLYYANLNLVATSQPKDLVISWNRHMCYSKRGFRSMAWLNCLQIKVVPSPDWKSLSFVSADFNYILRRLLLQVYSHCELIIVTLMKKKTNCTSTCEHSENIHKNHSNSFKNTKVFNIKHTNVHLVSLTDTCLLQLKTAAQIP